MKQLLMAAALALASCLAIARPVNNTHDAQQPFGFRDLVQLDRVSDPAVSPDGRLVSYTVRETDYEANKGRRSIWVVPADGTGPARRLTGSGNAFDACWGNDGALYFLSDRSGSTQVWRLALHGGEATAVTSLPLDVQSFTLSPTGDHLAVALEVFPDADTLEDTRRRLEALDKQPSAGRLYERLFIRHWDSWKVGTRSQLFTLALQDGVATGTPVRVSKGLDGDTPSKPFGGAEEYNFTADGQQIVFALREAGSTEAWSTNLDLWIAPTDGSRPPENLTAANKATDTGPVLSPDGRSLVWRAMRRPGFEADRYAIMLRELKTGTVREVAPQWDRSPDSLVFSADSRTLYAAADDLGQRRVFAIDVASGQVTALTGNGTVESFAIAPDGLVIAHNDLAHPTDLVLVRDGSSRQLTGHNAERLAQRSFSHYEPFQFAGAGGDTVHGYVVQPAGFVRGRQYPAVLIIHGGPQGSMGNHFHYRWNPQVFAAMGYAVVFIDFHGSTGYGQAFTDSISGDWGGKPLEDLQKGWAHVQSQYPWIDGHRAAALGASYGGFMINWIAGQWPDAFKCLVNHDGVFDNRSMTYSTEELWFDEWENGGTQYEHPEAFEKFNPVNHVAQWKTPMLVIQGGQDFRVPPEQGIATFTALQRRGIPSQLLFFPDENHWVLKPQNSVQWHETIEAWLKKWL